MSNGRLKTVFKGGKVSDVVWLDNMNILYLTSATKTSGNELWIADIEEPESKLVYPYGESLCVACTDGECLDIRSLLSRGK